MKKLLGLILGLLLIASFSHAGGFFGGGGGGTPGGSDTQVQFNNAGAFGGDADMTFTGGNKLNVDAIALPSTTSGTTEGYIDLGGAYFRSWVASSVYWGGGGGSTTSGAIQNSCLGQNSCPSMSTGDNNTSIGYGSCELVTTGAGNICIGNASGAGAGNISNKLYLDNTNDSTPTLYGELDNDRLCINCAAPTAALHLPAGIATAGYAPFKFTSGTNLTTPEAGAVEYNGSELFFSPSTVRHTLIRSAATSTTPTVTGFGTSPSVTASNGTHAFRVNVGTGGTASTGTITLPTAANGWNCFVNDVTNNASFVTSQDGGTTTTATVTNYSRTTGLAIAWTASDILAVNCVAY